MNKVSKVKDFYLRELPMPTVVLLRQCCRHFELARVQASSVFFCSAGLALVDSDSFSR